VATEFKGEIWKIESHRVGRLEAFRSEYQMEAFLMNNPGLIGCGALEEEEEQPLRLRQQVSTKKGTGIAGRIDLIGLAADDTGAQAFKIFELKNGKADKAAVEQLNNYLTGWRSDNDALHEAKRFLLQFVAEEKADQLLKSPQGVLIAPEFDPEAITEASSLKIDAVRLTRFRAPSNGYYVIIENVVGHAAKPMKYSWADLGIAPGDRLRFEAGAESLVARPDPAGIENRSSKGLIFEKTSAEALLQRKRELIDFAKRSAGEKEARRVEMYIEQIEAKPQAPIPISYATELGFFYCKITGAGYFTNPSQYWRVERTGRTIADMGGASENED